ncbi:MAG: hypothetical protein U0805_08350 [Pirellulales bacterium]
MPPPDEVRLLIDPPQPGAWNMAVDEALLEDAIDHGGASLRFYQWSEPTLSLGYFQRYTERVEHAASQDCAIVRRQSGGGAILHDRELTYSLILPPGHRLTRDAPHLYETVHAGFIRAITELCSQAAKGEYEAASLRIRGDIQGSNPSEAAEPFLCFQRQAVGDVVLPPSPSSGRAGLSQTPAESSKSATHSLLPLKVLGSAQRRHRGAILQHGSLLVERSPAAPELAGLRDLVGFAVGIDALISALCEKLAECLHLRPIPFALTTGLQSRAAELTNLKYGSPAWTARR